MRQGPPSSSGPTSGKAGLAHGAARPDGAATAYGGIAFTVQDARRRLGDLVSGALRIRSVAHLVSYLRDNLMTLESRSYAGGRQGTHYLKDQVSGGSVPAAAVTSRLSPRALATMSPVPHKVPAPRRARSPAQARPASHPSVASVRYRDAFRLAYRNQGPGYRNWVSLKTGLPSALGSEVAFTVSRGVGYIGSPGPDALHPLECSGTKASTRSELYAFVSRKLETEHGHVAPPVSRFMEQPEDAQDRFLSRYLVFDEGLSPGTPVLLRDARLVPSGEIHPDLAAPALVKAMGKDFGLFWAGVHKGRTDRSAREGQAVVDLAAFRQQLRSTSVADPGAGFGGVRQAPSVPLRGSSAPSVVIVSDERFPEPRACTHDPMGDHRPVIGVPTLHRLEPGKYPHLVMGDHRDTPSGFILVGHDRSVTYQDRHGREHNADGASHVPDPHGQGGERRWALDGQVMDRNRWMDMSASPQTVQEEDHPVNGFGHGGPP